MTIYETLDKWDKVAETWQEWMVEKLIYTWQHNTVLCVMILLNLALLIVCYLLILDNLKLTREKMDEIERRL